MLRICISGGIGMGKSTALELISGLGVRAVDTDRIARELTSLGQPVLQEIVGHFGSQFLQANGELDRKLLASRVFSDPEALVALESLLHPRIQGVWRSKLDEWEKDGCLFGMVIIPLLFEKGFEREFDLVVSVGCTSGTQKQRLELRGWSPDEIRRRMAVQMSPEEKHQRAHHVVWTEGSLGVHRRQWEMLLDRWKSLGSVSS